MTEVFGVPAEEQITVPADGSLGGCQWFLMCQNPATHTQSHPILGAVPICDRCQRSYDAN